MVDRTPPLRVVVVSPYGTAGGAESWLLQLLDATSRLDVDAILLQDGDLKGLLQDRDIAVTVMPVGRRPIDLVVPVARLAAELRRRQPDVVLTNGVKAHMVAGPAAQLAGIPVVWVKHDHSFDRLAPALGRLAQRVVATVQEVADPVRRPDTCILEPPATDRPPLDRQEARAVLAAHGVALDDALTLAMVGRLVPYKGMEDAIVALSRPGGRRWRLCVVGGDDASSPDETARLADLAADLGVADRVDFAGRIQDVGRAMAAFDALAVLTRPAGPRTPAREGFGMSAFEAMAAGVPVIAVEGGAVPRRLAGQAGVVVPPGDVAAVACALAALEDAAVRQRQGTAGRRLVAGHPDATAVADGLCRLLADVTGRSGAGLRPTAPVSVVVPLYNEGGVAVADIVEQLLPQTAQDDEIVLVDDGSTDDTAECAETIAAQHPERVRVVRRPRNGGVGAARNTGVSAARHEHIAFTDAGCMLSPSWLQAFRAALSERPHPDFVAGVYSPSETSSLTTATSVSWYPQTTEIGRATLLVRAYGRVLGLVFDRTRPAGRSIAFRRAAYVAVGGFREDMAATEDIDFSRAVAKAGGPIALARDASLTWVQAPTLRGSARMYRRYGRGDASSSDRQAVIRNLVRASVYVLAPWAVTSGGRAGRGAVALGAGVYLSLPLARAARRERPLLVMALVPIAMAVKDLAKAAGCLEGLWQRRAEGATASPPRLQR